LLSHLFNFTAAVSGMNYFVMKFQNIMLFD